MLTIVNCQYREIFCQKNLAHCTQNYRTIDQTSDPRFGKKQIYFKKCKAEPKPDMFEEKVGGAHPGGRLTSYDQGNDRPDSRN